MLEEGVDASLVARVKRDPAIREAEARDLLLARARISMAIVGTLGLASTMGISVTERIREFAVMKALGATDSRVSRVTIAEAVAVAGASRLFAFAASVPLSWGVDRLVGQLGFLAPLPLVVSVPAACAWLVLRGVVSILATSLPARRVARLTMREGLAGLRESRSRCSFEQPANLPSATACLTAANRRRAGRSSSVEAQG